MEWIEFSSNKPDRPIFAVVCNVAAGMIHAFAHYKPEKDVWILFDPDYRWPLALDVTKYIEIPSPLKIPREENP